MAKHADKKLRRLKYLLSAVICFGLAYGIGWWLTGSLILTGKLSPPVWILVVAMEGLTMLAASVLFLAGLLSVILAVTGEHWDWKSLFY